MSRRLTIAEKALLLAVSRGVECSLKGRRNKNISAKFLRELIVGQIDKELPTPKGIILSNANIIGLFDLSLIRRASGGGPIARIKFDECKFHQPIDFSNSHFEEIAFVRCEIPLFVARGARIAGDLSFNGSVIGDEKCAIAIARSTIEGAFNIRESSGVQTIANGEIILMHSTVGAVFMYGAVVKSKEDFSIRSDGLVIVGDFYIRIGASKKANITGGIRMLGADIGGDLGIHCDISSSDVFCIAASNVKVGGNVFLGNRAGVGDTKLLGTIDFTAAHIKGLFYLRDLVVADEGTIFDFERARVDGAVDFGVVKNQSAGRPSGDYVFKGAHFGRLGDIQDKSWPTKGHLRIDGFTYDHLDSYSSTEEADPSRLNWLALQFSGAGTREEFSPQPYEQLSRTLRSMGYNQAADKVAISKRRMRDLCGAESNGVRRMSKLMDIVSCHGYSPERAFISISLYLIVGIVLLSAAVLSDAVHALPARALPGTAAAHIPTTYTWWFGDIVTVSAGCPSLVIPAYVLDSILPFLDLGQRAECKMEAVGNVGGLLAATKTLYQIGGSVLATIFLATLSGILRRD